MASPGHRPKSDHAHGDAIGHTWFSTESEIPQMRLPAWSLVTSRSPGLRDPCPGGLALTKTLRASAKIAAPAGAIFESLADYKRAESFIDGLSELEPVGSSTTGKGAEFTAVLDVGTRKLNTTIVISEYEPNAKITWSSAGTEGQSLTFELRGENGATAVDLAVSYEEPGGIAGSLIAPFVERAVQHRADTALERLGEHVSPLG